MENYERLDALAARIVAVSNVVHAARVGETLRVISRAPTDFGRIERLAGDVDVEIAECISFPDTAIDRFHPEHLWEEIEWRNKYGNVCHSGTGKMLKARAELKEVPVMNAIVGDMLGIMFGSPEDKAAFDAHNSAIR